MITYMSALDVYTLCLHFVAALYVSTISVFYRIRCNTYDATAMRTPAPPPPRPGCYSTDHLDHLKSHHIDPYSLSVCDFNHTLIPLISLHIIINYE